MPHSVPAGRQQLIIPNLEHMLPIERDVLEKSIGEVGITNLLSATIRQICTLSKALENISEENFVHLELGNPGLPPEAVGIDAEMDALKAGVAGVYPDIAGIKPLKENGSKFVKAFLDLDIPPFCIIPTVGSMQGTFTMMLLLKQRIPEKDTMLFINPGFPAQRNQAKLLGFRTEDFDIYDYRGEKLAEKLESILKSGRVTGMIYSNPNNPAWTNFTDEELKIIGELATKYDVIVMEDLAYLGMDFREYVGSPGKAPFVSSIGKYTDNYILFISASKIFSYAGQRIALVCMSKEVYERKYPFLEKFYEMANFGDCYVYGVLYTASSGTSHSAQYALASMLEAACEGKLDFVGNCSEYGRRAHILKELFKKNGFHIVYSDDDGRDISDGFFFTAGYPGMDSEQLQKELLRFGIATIALPCTGSVQDGVRICVSKVDSDEVFSQLSERLKLFHNEH